MRRKKNKILFLIISLVALVSALYIIFSFPPNFELRLNFLNLPIVFLFFPAFSLFIFGIFSFFLGIRQGIIISLISCFYFILRLLGLTQSYFIAILLVLFLTFELLIRK